MASKPRRYGMAQVVGAVVVLTAAAALIASNFVHERGESIEAAKAWDIKGPPCPAFTAEQFAATRYKAPKTFDYDGATIGRAAGDVSCSDIKESGGKGFRNDRVCQFTSPVALTVTTKTSQAYFIPDVGQPATLIIHRGVARCVMASDYTLKSQ